MTGNTQIILRLICRICNTEGYENKIRGEAVDGIIESLGGIPLGDRKFLTLSPYHPNQRETYAYYSPYHFHIF